MRPEELLLRARPAEWAVWAPVVLSAAVWSWRSWRRGARARRERALEAAALAFDERRWPGPRPDPRDEVRQRLGMEWRL